MREYKFQAYDKDGIYTENGKPEMLENITGKTYFDHVWHDDDFIKRQWTGLKDKNGKEIYEGDIMNYRTYVFNDTGRKGIVCFDEKRSEYKLIPCTMYKENVDSNWSGHTFDFHICEASEVIGNIYENPEFLSNPSSDSISLA